MAGLKPESRQISIRRTITKILAASVTIAQMSRF
jgi:hypothetical protein